MHLLYFPLEIPDLFLVLGCLAFEVLDFMAVLDLVNLVVLLYLKEPSLIVLVLLLEFGQLFFLLFQG